MRHRYLLPALAASLLAVPCAHAQQPWQPFRPGLTYQLTEAATPGDTVHVLRVGAGAPVAGTTADTLFNFTSRVGRISEARSASNCYGTQRRRPDNLFGATLRSQPGAGFVLAAANGRTLLLRPRAAVGVSWATGRPGLTARVTGRSLAAVLGGAPDSVATIQFSDGQVLQLSKRYGWLSGPSLDSYLNGRYGRRQLTLTALPERRLGTPVTGALAAYDFQPGDVFQYISRSYTTGLGSNYLCQQRWWQDSVLTRQASRTGDTVTYTVRTWQRSQTYGTAGAPLGFCSTPSGTTVQPPTTHTTQVVGSQGTYGVPVLTSFFLTFTGNGIWKPATSVAARNSARLAGRYEFSSLLQANCTSTSPDSVVLTNPVDVGGLTRYATGLGFTYITSGGIYGYDITELTAFRKGSQTWGTFFPKGYLLAARPTLAAATTSAYPNPFTDQLTVCFSLASTQIVAVRLYDALGRAVRTASAGRLATGTQQLSLSTANLPLGVYTLVLDFEADGHRETLRLAKAE